MHEQFELDHDRGSSHGRTRIFRVAYPEAALGALRAGGVRGLERARPRPPRPLRADRARRRPALTSARALDECGVRYRLLDGTRCARTARSSPTAGRRSTSPTRASVFADRARHAFLESAGVEVETNRRIESTDELDADVVVVTAGSWIRDARPRRAGEGDARDGRVLQARGAASAVDRGPRRRRRGGHGMYSLHDPVHGLKAGAHHAGAEADPDTEAPPDPAIVERIASWVARTLPRRRSRACRGAVVPLHDHGRRALRPRAARPGRHRLRRARDTASSSRRRSAAGWRSWP